MSSVVTRTTAYFVPTATAQNSPWPSLAEQLTQVKAKPGTAFEQLIRDNQEFGMLRLDEAGDKRRLPPWVRVWWRKAHPELVYSSTDPTGGYPLVLKEIVEWMENHQDLNPAPADPSFPPPSTNSIEATVNGEQRISGPQTTPRSESDIRINYFDPTKILSASNAIVSSGHQAVFYSTDSGTNWGQTSLPFTASDSVHSDPTVDWTSDGRGWSSTLGIQGGTLRLRNYFTTDNGANWTFEATPSGSQTSVDKQMVWVDHNLSSPFLNQQYAIWHNGTPAFVSRRTAGVAGTWSAPLQITGAESTGTAIGSDIKTNSDGEVFAFWPTTGNRRIFVSKSTNGGTSYGTPVQVATTFDGFDIGVPSFNGRRALIYTSSAAYKTPSKNLVYTTWTDLSGDSGCTSAANEPGSNVASTCKTRIWFSRSTDGGATWSTPVKINNQAGLNDQFNQWLVVDETSGALAIMYYDTVSDAGRKKVHVYYQGSFNDGVTWSAPLQVTTAETDETSSGSDGGNQFGDYNGLSGYAGIFFPSWTDRRTGGREEIWTAKISDAACTAPGAPTIGTATATAPNQLQVTWSDGSPSSAGFNVYRAVGTCASPGAFTRIATNVAGSPFTDTTVSGGTTYSYRITGLDITGNCESPQSSCAQATATGACILPPTFAGLGSVANAALATCTLNLTWSAATANCSGPTTYSIYRATTSGFTPGPGTLISTTSSTSYTDSGALMSGTTYYYVVRATDTSNAITDINTVEKSGTPTGPVSLSTLTETFEGALSGGGFDNPGWTHQAISGGVDWVWSTAQSQTATHSWFSASQTAISERVLMTPVFGANASTTLSFWHTFDFETNTGGTTFYDGGTLEYTTNGGANWTVVPDANFTAGLFNATISSGFSNPIAGLRAWGGGTVGAMTQVTVNLAFLAGNNVMLRWREGDDSSAADVGWFVDSVTIANAGVPGSCVPTGGCPTITIDPATLPAGFVGTAYNQPLSASGGSGPYTFTLDSGSLPGNVNLTGGALVGTPDTTGVFNFVIKVTDSMKCTAMRNYTVVISGAGLMFYPLTPCRILDTRNPPGTPLAGGNTLTQVARGICGIPATAKAIVGNVTTVVPALQGFLTIFPSDAMQPLASTTNFPANAVLNNVFTVGLGNADGAFKIFASNTTHVVADVSGYYAPPAPGGLYYHPLPQPLRLVDTRPSSPACVNSGVPLNTGVAITYQGTTTCSGVTIPNGALALVGNATTVGPTGQGFITIYPAGVAAPLAASGNFQSGQTLNSQFYTGLSGTGQFSVITSIVGSGTTHLVVDLHGYFSTEAMDANGLGLLFSPLTPARLLDTRPAATGCFTPATPIIAVTDTSQLARGTCTIPATAQAIVGNATVVQPTINGFLTLWPSNVTRPFVASSNYVAGQILNRHFTIGLGTDGEFKLYSLSGTNLVVDVSGYFAP